MNSEKALTLGCEILKARCLVNIVFKRISSEQKDGKDLELLKDLCSVQLDLSNIFEKFNKHIEGKLRL